MRHTVLLAVLLAVGAVAAPARVERLPALTDPAAWVVAAGEDCLRLAPASGVLALDFQSLPDNTATLLLKQPVAIPEWADGFTWMGGNNGQPSGLWQHLLVADARGRQFRLYSHSWWSFGKGLFYPGHIQRRGRTVRFTVPALSRPVPLGRPGGNLESDNPHAVPEPPLKLLGFTFVGQSLHAADTWTSLYLGDFAFTHLTPGNSAFYYQFDDQECFGEFDPLPYVTPGQFDRWFGERFDLIWEVRDDYAGQPFLRGSKRVEPTRDGAVPYHAQLADRLTFPIRRPGTFWVRVRCQWYHRQLAVPEMIVEREYRLYVKTGDPAAELSGGADWAPGEGARVAPARPSLVWAATEPFRVDVVFQRHDAADLRCRVVVRPAAGGDPVAEAEAVPVWDDAGFCTVPVDVGDVPPGGYRVEATLLTGDKMLDRVERLVGRAGAAAPAGEVPASVPTVAQLLARPDPLVFLSPRTPQKYRDDQFGAFANCFLPFFDWAPELSRDIELQLAWRNAEPLPGVYDWRYLDAAIAEAGVRGLRLLVWPEFRAGNLPEWLPASYEENAQGAIFGHTGYLFHGARPNYLFDPAVREPLLRFVRAVAEHCRGAAAVDGYFFCFEAPGDAPYAGWTEGYAPLSRAAFRTHCRDTLRPLSTLAERWQTPLADWDAVQPPVGDAPQRQWVDWVRFRCAGIDGFLKDLVRQVRAVDDRRLVTVYGDGLEDIAWFRDHGCITANGGAHHMSGLANMATEALLGFPERTEEITPGRWAGVWPTQLDASVWCFAAGGGVHTIFKSYIDTDKTFAELQEPPFALARFARFQPIVAELRQTAVPDYRVFTLRDPDAHAARGHSTYGNWVDSWVTVPLQQAQVPNACFDPALYDRARLLIASRTQEWLAGATVDRLVRHVEAGGCLFMTATAGRHNLDDPATDWALLRRFGFAPPTDQQQDRYQRIDPTDDPFWPADAGPFVVRGPWLAAAPADGHTVATLPGHPDRPLLTWRPVGKGRVLVLWAETLVPWPGDVGHGGEYPVMAAVAAWAGVDRRAVADTRAFWVHCLSHRTRGPELSYVLVHNYWRDRWATEPVTGRVRVFDLPAGSYRVTEMIAARDLGSLGSTELAAAGIELTLGPCTVAIFRLERQPAGVTP